MNIYCQVPAVLTKQIYDFSLRSVFMKIIPLSFDQINHDFSMEIFHPKNQQVMILRNPSLTRDFLFMACLLCTLLSSSLSGQGLTGIVRETYAGQPVSNAVVRLLSSDSLIAMFSADTLGVYKYNTPLAGRYALEISALGYETVLEENILLNGYSTIRLEHFLTTNPYTLQGVSIIASPAPYLEKITKQDLEETAANFDDPVRVATSRPGIVQLNDQANHISVRGQNPFFNSWYLEGMEIVNPSHTNNAGTFSDYPTQSGGGINMFSAQILGSTEVYTGINPLTIDRNAGAVINMHLHSSTEKEIRYKAGLIGLEAGGAFPVGKRGMLDMNARYSFTGLLAAMGVDFGGEKISFQDAVVSYSYQGIRHELKIFYWGGLSENEFNQVEIRDEREKFKDFFDVDFRTLLSGAGIKSNLRISSATRWENGISYSYSGTEYSRKGEFGGTHIVLALDEDIQVLSVFSELSSRHSQSFSSKAGINYTLREITSFGPFNKENYIRPYLSGDIGFGPGLSFQPGIEVRYSLMDEELYPGYRATLQWNARFGLVHAGYRHSHGHALHNTLQSEESRPYKTDKWETGWNHRAGDHALSLTLFYQELDQLPVYFIEDGFVNIADRSDLAFGEVLHQQGAAKNYGLEASWNWRFRSLNFAFNQTLYKSETSLDGSAYQVGRFDGRHISHLIMSKEVIKEKRGKNRIWNFSVRGTWQGGLLEPEINTTDSEEFLTTIFENPGSYILPLPDYKRIDISISRVLANPRSKWRFALDIQNAFGFENIAYHYYDPFLHSIEAQQHLGIIPVLSVQFSR